MVAAACLAWALGFMGAKVWMPDRLDAVLCVLDYGGAVHTGSRGGGHKGTGSWGGAGAHRPGVNKLSEDPRLGCGHLDAAVVALPFGCWILGCWMPGAGVLMLDVVWQMWDAGCGRWYTAVRMLSLGCWICDVGIGVLCCGW